MLDAGPAQIGQAEQGHFSTMKNGRLVREFGFTRRLSSERGVLVLSDPWVKFYSKSQRIIYITATRASVPLEGGAGQIRVPERGTLEEKVIIRGYHLPQSETIAAGNEPASPRSITMNPPGATPASPASRQRSDMSDQQPEWTIEMEQVDFETEFSRITSGGAVKVKSNAFSAQGGDLMLRYDQLNERLQELELRRLDWMEINGSDSSLGSGDSSAGGERQSSDKTDSTSKKQKTDKKQSDVYRLVLSQDVRVEQDQDVLTADQMAIVMGSDYSTSMGRKPADSPSSTQSRSAVKSPPKAPSGGFNFEPGKTARVTCRGGLTVTAVDQPDPDTGLTFAAQGNPIQLRRAGQIVMESQKLNYSHDTGLFDLTAADDRPVKLSLSPQQWVTAHKSVRVEENTGWAMLSGPGVIEYIPDRQTAEKTNSESQSVPAQIRYEDHLKVKFAMTTASPTRRSEILWGQASEIEFTGRLNAKTTNGEVSADQGSLTFYPDDTPFPAAKPGGTTVQSPEQSRRIKTLQLSGHINAEGPGNRFTADQLTAEFTLPPKATSTDESTVHHIVARGDVEAEDDSYLIQAAESLEMTFDATPDLKSGASGTDSSAAVVKSRDNSSSAATGESGLGFDRIMSRKKPNQVLASGPGGKVRLKDKKQKLSLTGDRVEGNAVTDQWTIKGDPARIVMADQDTLQGSTLIIDRSKETYEVVGKGRITAMTRTDLTGSALRDAAPITIDWTQSAVYHATGNRISFQGVTARLDQQRAEKRQSGEMTCPTMTVYLTGENRPPHHRIK
jgi:lipopolysaccharide export system protein LptA